MRFVLMSLCALALAGCAGHRSTVPLNSYQSVTAPEAPAPGTAPAAPGAAPVAAPAAYRIGASDVIRIDVFGEPDLSLRDLPVDPDGRIVMPMVGPIQAEGRTTEELSNAIAAALDRYLRQPRVAVNVTQLASQKVTVTGAVRTPGVYQALPGMTLMDTVAVGQGLTDASKSDEVLVFRRESGKRYVARFDLAMIQNGQMADPVVQPGDTVVVGYNNSRRLFGTALGILPVVVGIFIALLN